MIDVSHAYRVIVLGGDLTSAGGVAGTLIATSWTLGGPVGVAVAMFGLGYFAASMDGNRGVRGRLSPTGIIWYALGLVTIFHTFRQGTIGWVAMIVVFQQLGMMIALATLAMIDRAPRSARQMVAASKS